jgi:Bacterial RNA polymerase, alpha chain C terminal domain
MRNARQTLQFYLSAFRGTLEDIGDTELARIIELLLTGIEAKYAEAWKAYCGFERDALNFSAIGQELGVSPAAAKNLVARTNEELKRPGRRRILGDVLEKGAYTYEGNARPIVFLGLSARAMNALEAEGFFSIHDLVQNLSENQLRFKTPNLGALSAAEIIEALAKEGVTLRPY